MSNRVINTEKLFSDVIKVNNIEVDESKHDEILGICPVCKNGQVVKNKKGYGCSNWQQGCKFFIADICGKSIEPKYIKQLIQYGKTELINGFNSKKGTQFSARLILKDNKVEFDFS